MQKLNLLSLLLLCGLLFTSITACSDDDADDMPDPQTIAEIAADDDRFTTLVSALERVDLVGILDGAGTYTVFAPTNDAFDGVDIDALSDEALTEVLLYHVLGAEVPSTAIQDGQTYATTAATTGPDGNQLSILIEKSTSGVRINNVASVTTADIEATNGVIHVVDEVIMPLDIVGHAAANSNFSELVAALGAASGDLVSVLSGEGPFTVFAPLNSAFEEIAGVTAGLTADQLNKVLTYHVAANNVRSDVLTDGMMVSTVNGENFTINIQNGAVSITDAQGNISTVVLTDVQATNGVIHAIDKVLLPNDL